MVEDSCRGSADDRHGREVRAPARTREAREGMLELVSCLKCGCGKFRCVAAEIMTRYDKTKNEAGRVD